MESTIRVGACQTPEIVGDPNLALKFLLQFAREAETKNVDLLLFPECYLTGYILNESYFASYAFDFDSAQFNEILEKLKDIKPVLVFGIGERRAGKYFNSAIVVDGGKLIGCYRKTHLIDPNELFFTPGEDYPVFEIKGLKYGINICYDAQFADAAKALANQGAKLMLLSAQNMMRRQNAEKWKYRHNEIRSMRVRENHLWLASSDVTGIRPADQYGIERIAYGPTLVMNPQAEVLAQVPIMTTGMVAVDIPV